MGIWQAGAAGLLLFELLLASAFAADLQNPDFETPPTNIPKNSTNPFIPLNSTINIIPGWSYQGTVQYVISSGQEGNAIYLGQNGKINQTFRAIEEFDQNYDYLLTFKLKPAQPNCTSPTSVTISVPNTSVVFSFEKKFGNQSNWQTHACYLGVHGTKELINLTLENQSTNQSTNTTKCGVVLDSFILKLIPNPISYDNNVVFENGRKTKETNNLVLNGGFEVGPAFPNNSSGGIIMDAESNPTRSPLNQWAILGTVKYVAANKDYQVPERVAAIELVSGKSSGVQTTVTLKKGSKYDLKVYFSRNNDACIGTFKVGVQAGSTVENFTIENSEGMLWSGFTWTIKADSSVTPISIRSSATTKTKDHVFCGPVIDNVVLVASYGLKLQISVLFVGIGLLVTLAQITG
ncbi:hypothetical protein MKX01_018905 [Papaver californicum]|nr:hypothetical protein MKX01_018905 [Papaver californicum]